MARIRTIKPEFFKHEGLAELPPLHRILFAGLWGQSDGEGRLQDRPKRLKIEILPYDECDIDAMLNDLAAAEFIVRYTVDGERYIWVPKLRKHQRITGKEAETPSIYPPPTDEALGKQSRNIGETANVQEGKGREWKGEEGVGEGNTPATADEKQFAEVSNAYSNNIGLLTPAIRDALITALDDYGYEWLMCAINKASLAEKRSMSYINGILKGFKRDGFNQANAPPSGGKAENAAAALAASVAHYEAFVATMADAAPIQVYRAYAAQYPDAAVIHHPDTPYPIIKRHLPRSNANV